MSVERAAKLLVVRDQRGEDRYLRASWHADTHSIVLSHWSGGVCTASTRLALADVPGLIGFLVDTLHHAATARLSSPATEAAPERRREGLAARAEPWIPPTGGPGGPGHRPERASPKARPRPARPPSPAERSLSRY